MPVAEPTLCGGRQGRACLYAPALIRNAVGRVRVAEQPHGLACPLPHPSVSRVDECPRVVRPRRHAFFRRRVVDEVLDHVTGVLQRGVLKQLRAQLI